MAPKFLTYLDSKGRPVGAIVIQICFGLLAFINEDKVAGSQFFNWLLAITGLAGLFCWGSICLAHIRFRAGWKAQGRTVDEIPWQTPTGVWGSWCGFILVALLLIAEFYISVWVSKTSELLIFASHNVLTRYFSSPSVSRLTQHPSSRTTSPLSSHLVFTYFGRSLAKISHCSSEHQTWILTLEGEPSTPRKRRRSMPISRQDLSGGRCTLRSSKKPPHLARLADRIGNRYEKLTCRY